VTSLASLVPRSQNRVHTYTYIGSLFLFASPGVLQRRILQGLSSFGVSGRVCSDSPQRCGAWAFLQPNATDVWLGLQPVVAFNNIPYSVPVARFQPSELWTEPWTNVLDGRETRFNCESPDHMGLDYGGPDNVGEDCLKLDLHTPLPLLVDIQSVGGCPTAATPCAEPSRARVGGQATTDPWRVALNVGIGQISTRGQRATSCSR
jgi:hypothetical protein